MLKYRNNMGMNNLRLALSVCVIGCLVGTTLLAQRMIRVRPDRYEEPTRTKTISLDRIENLSFTSSSYLNGRLTIRAADIPTARISYRLQFKVDSEEMAEEFASYITIAFEDLENEFAISAETKASPPWRGSDFSAGVDVEIEVPTKNNLKIFARTSQFEIDIEGPFAGADITSNFGDITLKKITSKVNVSSDNGAVSVEDCSGPTKVTTSNRPITLQNVDGQLGSIRLRNENGRISLDSVRGEIDARTEFAQISASRIRFESGRSTLATENSNINLDASLVAGDVSVRSENGKIDMSIPMSASAAVLLQVEEGGRIYTKLLPIKVDRVTRTLVQGQIGDGQNKIEVDMAGVGTINLEGTRTAPLSNR
ncbi:MAG: DUF4097 family beta strand repeat-containing protein [Candidatus Zixiibacteriota bacterium]